MSETFKDPIDLRAVLAKIDRDRAETGKLFAEVSKLNAEGRKFNRDPWILALTALLGILAAVVARLPEILRAMGVGHE